MCSKHPRIQRVAAASCSPSCTMPSNISNRLSSQNPQHLSLPPCSSPGHHSLGNPLPPREYGLQKLLLIVPISLLSRWLLKTLSLGDKMQAYGMP